MLKKALVGYFFAAFLGAALFIYFTFPRNASQFWPSRNQERHLPPVPAQSAPSAPNGEPAAKPTGVVLRVMTWARREEIDALQARADAYAQRTGVTVALTVSPDETTYRLDLAQALIGTEPPDLCQIDSRDFSGLNPQADLIIFDPPQSLPSANALQAFTVNKNLRALPSEAETEVLYYNKQLFDRAGLAYPGTHWTLDILLSITRALTAQQMKDKAGQPIYGLELPVNFSLLNLLSAEAGAPLLDASGWHLGDPVFADRQIYALNFLHDLFHVYAITAPQPNKNEAAGFYFQAGRAALWLGSTQEADTLGSLSWSMTPWPRDFARTVPGHFIAWTVLGRSAHVLEAEKLAKALAQHPVHRGMLSPILPTSETGLSEIELTEAQALASSFLVPNPPDAVTALPKLDKLLRDDLENSKSPAVADLYQQLQAVVKPATKP